MDESHAFARVVVSGEFVEFYRYETPIKVGFARQHEIVRREKDSDEELEKRSDNLYRSRKNIRRIIWANECQYTKFITLTYAETCLDVKKVHRDIQTFTQAMKRNGIPMKYLYVLENQKERGEKEGNEGSIHVHMVLFVEQKIPLEILNKCWNHGNTDIGAARKIKNLGAYVCKYITKDNLAEFGDRVFSCSLGLNREREEVFYTEGYSTTEIGVHPDEVLKNLNIHYENEMRIDFIDENGEFRTQKIKYYQGKWSDIEMLIGLSKKEKQKEKERVKADA